MGDPPCRNQQAYRAAPANPEPRARLVLERATACPETFRFRSTFPLEKFVKLTVTGSNTGSIPAQPVDDLTSIHRNHVAAIFIKTLTQLMHLINTNLTPEQVK